MRSRVLAAIGFSLAAGAALAAPMAESLRPLSRPASRPAGFTAEIADAGAPHLRPRPRPEAPAPEVMRAALGPGFALVLPAALPDLRPAPRPAGIAARTAPLLAALPAAPGASPRPEARQVARQATRRIPLIGGGPEMIQTAAFRAPQATGPVTSRKGTVCGDPAIVGKSIPPILAKTKGCGLDEGVSVTSVAGVALSQPASIDCATARSLKDWVEGGVKPAVGRKGGGVVALQVAASYSCRPRNNQKGAKISEHGRGRAVDIAAILLADGTAVTVAKGWGTKSAGKTLAAMRKAACGPFNTVLGPGSDPFHGDHFHLDTARGRGPYCR
jgi:hypothetical protein